MNHCLAKANEQYQDLKHDLCILSNQWAFIITGLIPNVCMNCSHLKAEKNSHEK